MSRTTSHGPIAPTAPVGGPWKRFFTNQSRFEFIGRSRLWLAVSVLLIVICVAGVALRGLDFGIDFTGGASFAVSDAPSPLDPDELRNTVGAIDGVTEATVQVYDGGAGAVINIQQADEAGQATETAVLDAIVTETGVDRDAIDVSVVGPRWGEQISDQMLRALAVFLAAVVVYLSLRFEWRMAAAAVVTTMHDIVVTVGVYAIVGFPVSPASVIALLTILGYSLYDTVVVFDRVTDETRDLAATKETYGQAANRALNEVLLRSLSTSITSLLPVGALLFIGANLLGADTLADLALALFVGMAAGTYSSIFIATPVLVWLKERHPRRATPPEAHARLETR